MTTALITHPDCETHDPPTGHPEQRARLPVVLGALESLGMQRVTAPMAAEDDLLRVHPRAYLDRLRAARPERGFAQLDADTWMSPGSLAAAYRAAGGAVRGVDMVLGGEAPNAFVATRPPGHHAEAETPMGFCMLGNVAVAAKHALDHHGLKRVAVVDFDVHHGNGTQALLQGDARVLFVSSHQMPLWPGTGAASDTGDHDNVLNLPLAPGTDGTTFRRTHEDHTLPAVDAFAPDLLLVSAGFDAHAADPLANLRLQEADFAWITGALCDLAAAHCGGRLVSCLEGGYDLAALAESAAAHARALTERAG